MSGPVLEGTVVENRGELFDVIVDGRVVKCSLRGKLKKDKQRAVSPVAAGDKVRLAMLEPGRGVIEQVLPRESGLSRTAAGGKPLQHTLVANVDQAVIVFAAAEPRPDLFMLDRFLVAAVASELEPLICVNKVDLVDGEPLRARFAVYRQCDFRVLLTSATTGDGLEELRAGLKDRRSVLCGPSGVGKSSLINAVAPGLKLKTAETGDVTHKGRHATTSIKLLELPFGGWVADTAGLRQFGFWEVEPGHIAAAFPDVMRFAQSCNFSDCGHGDEPGCAVKRAVADGDLDARRATSYGQLAGR